MLKIGKLELKSNVVAAPLAGFSDLYWRIIVAEMGAGLVFSEMIASEGLKRAHKRTLKYLKNNDRARPFGVQLYGKNPESFVNAIDIISGHPFDLLDINMGCPVRKVVSRGEGSALMKDPERVRAIIKAVRAKYAGPLTVKFRSGWDENSINAVEIAKIAEGEGVDAVVVHGRTKTQIFTGHADWKIIAAVKNAVKIPVIGNGDVVDKISAEKMFAETGCDGIMIGRAAIANPWIFREIAGFPSPTVKERFALMNRHYSLVMEHEDNRFASNVIRKFTPKYLKGVRGHKELAGKMGPIKKSTELMKCLEEFEAFISKQ